MQCPPGLANREIARNDRSLAGLKISHSQKDNGKDIHYCGGHFQSPNGAIQPRRCEVEHQNKPKTLRSRRSEYPRHNGDAAEHASSRNPPPQSLHSQRPASQHSIQPLNPSSTRLAHHQPLPTQQLSEPASLPFPNYAHTSSSQLSSTYYPPPVTYCYQLDRFLDEIPDFRSASLSGKPGCVNGRSKGAERSRRHCNGLKATVRSLQGSIEGF